MFVLPFGSQFPRQRLRPHWFAPSRPERSGVEGEKVIKAMNLPPPIASQRHIRPSAALVRPDAGQLLVSEDEIVRGHRALPHP